MLEVTGSCPQEALHFAWVTVSVDQWCSTTSVDLPALQVTVCPSLMEKLARTLGEAPGLAADRPHHCLLLTVTRGR